jgi:hypothetical protein
MGSVVLVSAVCREAFLSLWSTLTPDFLEIVLNYSSLAELENRRQRESEYGDAVIAAHLRAAANPYYKLI